MSIISSENSRYVAEFRRRYPESVVDVTPEEYEELSSPSSICGEICEQLPSELPSEKRADMGEGVLKKVYEAVLSNKKVKHRKKTSVANALQRLG